MVIYKYTRRDLFQQPNTYMYSKYEGRDFIYAYIDERLESISKLSGCPKDRLSEYSFRYKLFNRTFEARRLSVTEMTEKEIAYFRCISSSTSIETKCLLEVMMKINLYNREKEFPNYLDILNIFIKKIEISKLLFMKYGPNLKRGFDSYRYIFNYSALSALFGFEILKGDSLLLLNALLKLNDVVSSVCDSMKETIDKQLALLGFLVELERIFAAIKEMGF